MTPGKTGRPAVEKIGMILKKNRNVDNYGRKDILLWNEIMKEILHSLKHKHAPWI
jgi:hypothetical protein